MSWARRIAILGAAVGTVACSRAEPSPELKAEVIARERFARGVAIDAGAERALGVGSRTDVLFEDGFSVVSYDPPDDFHNHAFRWMGARGHVRLAGHGAHAMRLSMEGYINEKVIRSKSVITVYLDGIRIFDAPADETGIWRMGVSLPADVLRHEGWMDLVLAVSAVGFFWAEPPELRVVVLNKLEWKEADQSGQQ